jgi:phage terminase large subunit-like protein
VTIALSPLELSILSKTAALFEPPKLSPYLTDPVGFVTKELDEHLWSKQCDIAASVVTNRRTAVRSCHSAGKSFLASRIAAWWIATHPPGEAFVASTAPSYPQVHAILWEEIRKAARKSDAIPGRVLQSDEWKLDDGTLVGWGRKPADTDEHGFHGIHRRFVLVILDEACGIPSQLWTAVEAITTNADCRILAIGNPDDPNTEFASVCKPGSGWNVIEINGLTTPNMTPEAVAAYPQLAALFAELGIEPTAELVPDGLRPLMLDPEWVVDKIKRWGVDSPRFTSKVLGRFPDIGVDTLISPSLIEAAQARHLEASGRAILGVDVARYGADSTVIYVRRGPVIRLHGEYAKQDTMETTGKVIAAKRETGADEIRVDGVGVGGGVVDRLTEQGYGVLDMQAGASARDKERFANARAEWAWAMRTRLEDGDIDLDPADEDLAAQLGSIKYRYNSRGQIVIESKDEARKRGIPSPDNADAALLTTASPAGADLFARLRWRVWSWALDAGQGRSVACAARTWPLSSTWTFATAHIALGEDAATDFTVVSVWARTLDGDLVLLDRARRRLGEDNPVDLIRTATASWNVDTTFVTKQQLTLLHRGGLQRPGVHLTPLDVDPDPYSRVLPASAFVAGGKVWLPSAAAWREQWMSEHLAWPNSKASGSVTSLALAVFAAATQWVPPATSVQPAREQSNDFAALGGGSVDFMNVAMNA